MAFRSTTKSKAKQRKENNKRIKETTDPSQFHHCLRKDPYFERVATSSSHKDSKRPSPLLLQPMGRYSLHVADSPCSRLPLHSHPARGQDPSRIRGHVGWEGVPAVFAARRWPVGGQGSVICEHELVSLQADNACSNYGTNGQSTNHRNEKPSLGAGGVLLGVLEIGRHSEADLATVKIDGDERVTLMMVGSVLCCENSRRSCTRKPRRWEYLYKRASSQVRSE